MTSVAVLAWTSLKVRVAHAFGYNLFGYWKPGTAPLGSPGLWSFGYGGLGGTGLGNETHRSSPTQVGSLTDWQSVSTGPSGSFAVRTNGTLWAWGENSYGTLGLRDIIHRSSPTQVGSLTSWSAVTNFSGNSYHALALRTNGSLWAWGDNYYGQLGTGNQTNRSSPTQVGSLTSWRAISTGEQHSVALKTDGTLWAWGYNGYGQLGVMPSWLLVNRSSPAQVDSLTTWSIVEAGERSSFGIKSDGTLWALGENNYGQLGVGNRVDRSSPTQVGSLTNWKQITSRYGQTVALKTDGTIWGMGANNYNIFNFARAALSSPVQIGSSTDWRDVSTATSFIVAIKSNGTLWAWGDGGGQLTLGCGSSPTQIGSLTDWSSLSAHYGYTMAIKSDGTLWTWGFGGQGKLGLGDLDTRSSPVQVGTLTDWARVVTGEQNAAAIKSNGTLWTWGLGALGLGDTDARSSPTQVGSLGGWQSISLGYYQTLATRTNGTLWAWGINPFGELGFGGNFMDSRSSPAQIGSLTTWKSVSAGNGHSLAAMSDGTFWAWGASSNGQIALTMTIPASTSSPVQVGTLADWSTSFACGKYSTHAIKTDGTLWAWGANYYGQLAFSDTFDRSSPVRVGSLTDWKRIAGGEDFAIAIKTSGTLWGWGNNNQMQLGLGAYGGYHSSPVQIGSLTHWSAISCGYNHSLALTTSGTAWGWGYSNYGELGKGNTNNHSSPVQIGSAGGWTSVSAGLYLSFLNRKA